MTDEERDLITRFVQRVAGPSGAPSFTSSVPTTAAPALPPIDREADALLAELFARYPEARYRISQSAFVAEHALAEAQNRIERLQWELDQARQAPPPQPAASPWGQAADPGPQPSRGLLGGLFGGRAAPPPQQGYALPPQYAPPPQPQYAPGYQPGMFQRPGSGFLGSALTTAAGVAGGMVVGNALMNMFSPHQAAAEGFPSSYQPLPEPPPPPPPPQIESDPYASGGAPKDDMPVDDTSWSDSSGYDGGSDDLA